MLEHMFRIKYLWDSFRAFEIRMMTLQLFWGSKRELFLHSNWSYVGGMLSGRGARDLKFTFRHEETIAMNIPFLEFRRTSADVDVGLVFRSLA